MTSTAPNALTPLAGLHFLIHPFYDASLGTHERLLTETEFNDRGRPRGFLYVPQRDIEEDLGRYPALSQAYAERAGALRERETLVVFLPQEEGFLAFFDRRFERMYLNFLLHLQDLLGPRLVLFYKDADPVNDRGAGSAVRKELGRRGFGVRPETPSHAFGETLDHCVPRAVENLRKGLGLRKLTRVHPLFTDLRFEWPELGPEERLRWRREMRRYGIVLETQGR